ncbi:MAG: hypothetical protein ABUS51_00610, partial [Acidobacteriota bacterium]
MQEAGKCMKMRGLSAAAVGLLAMAALAGAQTRVDLGSQGRNVDFSSASSTRPFRAGSVLPGGCQSGEVFMAANGSQGYTLNVCNSSNVWTQLGGITRWNALANPVADLGLNVGGYSTILT